MPLYEYECQQCHRHTEKRQKFSDPEITQCPHCGGPLDRVLSAPAIAFKGGGWYADGYGNAKPKPSSEGSSPKENSGENKGTPGTAESAPKSNAPEPAASSPAAAPASSPAPSSSSSAPAPSNKADL